MLAVSPPPDGKRPKCEACIGPRGRGVQIPNPARCLLSCEARSNSSLRTCGTRAGLGHPQAVPACIADASVDGYSVAGWTTGRIRDRLCVPACTTTCIGRARRADHRSGRYAMQQLRIRR
eukprot:scaffold19639_cov65-Phaeocystis_antarctica.AAC.5